MKSEHRRELHANELEKLTEGIGKFFERHGSKVLIGLLGAVVVGVGIYFVMTWGGKTAESASDQLAKAEETSDFTQVAENPDYAKLKLQLYARLVAAERQLEEGNRLYITSKKGGLDVLKEAKEKFESVAAAAGVPNNAKERALRGLAYTLESMSEGDTTEAVKAYETYLKEFPDTPWKKLIERRIAALKTPRAKELYAFLSSDDRKPADRKLPADIEKLRKIPGHEKAIFGAEKPVELPRIPFRLRRDLDDGSDAQPFPKGLPSGTGKKAPETKSGPAFPKAPKKSGSTDQAQPFRAPDTKPDAKKAAAKKPASK